MNKGVSRVFHESLMKIAILLITVIKGNENRISGRPQSSNNITYMCWRSFIIVQIITLLIPYSVAMLAIPASTELPPPPRHTPPPRNVVGMSKGKSLQKNSVNALCCHLAILCTSVSLSNFKLVQNLQKFFSKASAFFSSFSFLSKYNFPVKGYQDRIVDKSQICSPGDLK